MSTPNGKPNPDYSGDVYNSGWCNERHNRLEKLFETTHDKLDDLKNSLTAHVAESKGRRGSFAELPPWLKTLIYMVAAAALGAGGYTAGDIAAPVPVEIPAK
jgi:hypothetical protein